MRRQYIASMVITSAAVCFDGIALATQDRLALRSPSGISFSEFKEYEGWQAIISNLPDGAGLTAGPNWSAS